MSALRAPLSALRARVRPGIPRSSRSTPASACRSCPPRSAVRRPWTTSPTRSWTSSPATGSTWSGSSASGRPARPRAACRRRIPSGWRNITGSCRTSRRPTSAGPASPSATITSTPTSAETTPSPACANACASAGCGSILDFVPNHVAPDHRWVEEHPDFFIAGTEEQLAAQPQNYRRLDTAGGSRILAYGRDPYFAGWPDTLQLNYGNPALQDALLGELQRIAGQCDGVRCDMAMLVLPEIFERTWGISASPFWPRATAAVRAQVPASSSWPRSTGTSNGRSSSRGSTTRTTSGSTTASCTALRALSASTSWPGSTSRITWRASSRTTTSRAPRRRSHRMSTRRRP